ncbi:343_t:CDS:2, partial [Dentiscutata heterogama]
FGVKSRCVTLELTEYYMKRGMFNNERFENTLEAILTTKSLTDCIVLKLTWHHASIFFSEWDGFKIQDTITSKPVNKLNIELNSRLDGPGHSKIMCNNSETPNYDNYDIDNNYNSNDDYSNDENEEITNEESIIRE